MGEVRKVSLGGTEEGRSKEEEKRDREDERENERGEGRDERSRWEGVRG